MEVPKTTIFFNLVIMFKGKIKVGVEQRKVLFDMMLLHHVFNHINTELIERVFATGYYTNDEQIHLNNIRQIYIEYNTISKVIDI
jgi:hypothetical protein